MHTGAGRKDLQFGISSDRWEDNIKRNLKKIGWKGAE